MFSSVIFPGTLSQVTVALQTSLIRLDLQQKTTKESIWLDGGIGLEPSRRGLQENASYVVVLLKACTKQEDLSKGAKLHAYIQEHNFFENNCHVASSLVSMYARCGALAKAQQVVDELHVRDVVTWNALIAGYAQQGQGKEALKCIDCMKCDGLSPNVVTFICALKACGSIAEVRKGEEIHENIVCLGMLDKDILLGNILVDMYARCGALIKAQQVFNELPVRDVGSWTALIAGYSQKGQGEEALNCFEYMQYEGYVPDTVTFICALKACGNVGAAGKGEEIHCRMNSLGLLEKDIVLGNTLVDMYARCGALGEAQQVLDMLPVRNLISWTALIAGYVQEGQGEEALKCFDGMQSEGHSPDAVTLICVLKACGSIGATAKGEEIHYMVVYLGMLENDIMLGNTLVDMYARCGTLEKAHQVLNRLPVRNVVSWNALIAGYAEQDQGEEALRCFDSLQHEGHTPNVVTFICALKACGSLRAAMMGEQIHDKIVSLGMFDKDIVLGSTLVDTYAKFGALAKAQQVFDELPVRNVVSWNAVIAGYAQQGQDEEALESFDIMQCEGHTPDAVTFICALKACRNLGATCKGKQIHDQIGHFGILEKDTVIGTALVDMYARCGELAKAQEVIENLPERNVTLWSAIMAECVRRGQGEEALKCFDNMQHDGHSPNVDTLIFALKACGNIGAAAKGEQIHDGIVNLGFLEKDIVFRNLLVDMYAKCAALGKAMELFKDFPIQDVVTWNALLGGYTQRGLIEEALDCIQRMRCKGLGPDSTTLISLLNACSHSGLLDEAEIYFLRLSSDFDIHLDVEHFCCMVDLFGRSGMFDRALVLIKKMPIVDYVPVWIALLGACSKWRDVKIGKLAFEHVLCLDRSSAAAYVCMANIYTACAMLEDADKIKVE